MPVYPQQPPALLRCCLRRPRAVKRGRSPRTTATVIHQDSPSALQRLAGYEISRSGDQRRLGRPSHGLPGQVTWRLPVGWDGYCAGQSRGRDCRVAGGISDERDLRAARRHAAPSTHRCCAVNSQVLILGAAHLLAVPAEYQQHYNTARPHQGIGQRVPKLNTSLPASRQGTSTLARSRRKLVLSGLINEYVRAA